MAALALYRKYRPKRWEEVIGQQAVVRTLRNAIASEHIGHAYLFSGPRGTGKTTTARLLAKAVNCLDPDPEKRPCDRCEHCRSLDEGRFLDLVEIDAASNTSVDDVRDLRDKIAFMPNEGRYRVYIIDEVHMLSTAAFNALLKTLEEPPSHVIFVLATTEVHKVPATVLSRCQRFDFRRIPVSEITAELESIVGAEGIQADGEALRLIARQATGSMRDALSLLDQLASSGEPVTLDFAQAMLGMSTPETAVHLADALITKDALAGLEVIHEAVDQGSEPRQLARQVVDYLRALLLISLGSEEQVDATPEDLERMQRQAHALGLTTLLPALQAFNQAASQPASPWQPTLALELALMQVLAGQHEVVPVEAEENHRAGLTSQSQALERPEARPAGAAQAPVVSGRSVAEGTPVEAAILAAEAGAEAAAPEGNPERPIRAETTAVEAQTAEVETGSGHPPGELTFEVLQEAWPRIRAEVKRRRSQTEALLNSVRGVAIRNGELVLTFASEVLRSKMEQPENIKALQEALRVVLGEELGIRCAAAPRGHRADASNPPIEGGGMVDEALKLGGKIVDHD
jgi:DNA polymerase-3 subunit gamma/tau